MNYRSISTYLLWATVAGIICLLPSCMNDEKEQNQMKVDRSPMLESLADKVIIPAYTVFHTAAFGLNEHIQAFAETPSQETLSDAREQFHTAYHSWQHVALFDFGPAFTHTLRANVNTFPTDNFSIDNAIASGTLELDKISAQNKKGLPALDYLLFGLAETDQEMLQLYTDGENAAHRRAYLTAVAEDILLKTDQVYNGWLEAEGNYRDTFIDKDGTDVGSSIGQMVNAFSQYFERFNRDARIGVPLGKRSQGTPIPRNVEAYYSGKSISLATENLKGVINFFKGGNGEGLHDYLKSLDTKHNDRLLADVVLDQFETAEKKVTAIPSPLTEAVTSNTEPVDAAHKELQKAVILIKVDMASALGVLITYQDNDGD
ncbi:imelysin family protein [Echinicola soli]|uniref:Imelysin family protein n=1 Tax=Echinicola soli TaxID=2591634 RepID=A0A514CLC7_9BACT|nr:imelysin family protein [Echinicola soli]QDH80557.1 imelysin family protein [Echinicola soli]